MKYVLSREMVSKGKRALASAGRRSWASLAELAGVASIAAGVWHYASPLAGIVIGGVYAIILANVRGR